MTPLAGIVIIGAGEGGARAAVALRENGYDGPIDLVGEEPHLPYERPPLSKAVLAGDLVNATFSTTNEQLASAGIAYHVGVAATGVDRGHKLVHLGNDVSLPYHKLLLATGARPRKITQDGADLGGIRYLRNLNDCVALRSEISQGTRVAVIGAGFLGLEIAASCVERGATVVVVESQPRVLMRGVPEPVARVVAGLHRQHGVDIRINTKIARIEAGQGPARVLLEDGNCIVADIVVASIGAVPNTQLAEAAGLAVDNGILVDGRLATSDGDIFAAGDCCAFPLASQDGKIVRLESWRNALDQGATAAKNMLGDSTTYSSVPWFWSDQFEMTLQVAGMAHPDHEVVRRDLGDDAFILFHLDETGRLVAASGIGKRGLIARDIKLSELLISQRCRPDPEALRIPGAKLKAMLLT